MDIKIWENGEPNPYHSLLDAQRILVLEMTALFCSKLPGAGAEIGVYQGGSLIRAAKSFKRSVFYGIDTFEGMPEPSDKDLHRKGDFSDCNFDFMVAFFKNTIPNVNLIKGFFPDPSVLKQITDDKFSYVHVDVDLYRSTKDCLEYFVPKLVINGILIVDDYGFPTTPGAKEAVDEYVVTLLRTEYDCKALVTKQYRIQRIE